MFSQAEKRLSFPTPGLSVGLEKWADAAEHTRSGTPQHRPPRNSDSFPWLIRIAFLALFASFVLTTKAEAAAAVAKAADGTELAAEAAIATSAEPLFAGLAYGPSGSYTVSPSLNVPEARIRADLQLLATVTRRIRTYSVGNGMDRVPEIARPLGMKVSLGIWLGPDKAENSKEIAKALTVIAANADVIDRVFVGSETLQRKDLPLKDIIASLRRVRHAVRGRNIEVTTGEIWSVWLANPSLGQECDVIGVHIHPYWDGYSVGEAVNGVIARLEQIQQEFPGKRVIIAETGWPSVGAVRGAAAPSPAGQAYFTSAFLDEARTRQLDYYIVEAFDQPWKVGGEGEVGTGWGLFDVKTRSKLNLAGISPLAPE